MNIADELRKLADKVEKKEKAKKASSLEFLDWRGEGLRISALNGDGVTYPVEMVEAGFGVISPTVVILCAERLKELGYTAEEK